MLPIAQKLYHTGKCIRRFGGYLRVLPVLQGEDVVGIFFCVNTKKKNMPYAKGTIYSNQLGVQYVHADYCKHLGIDSSTDRIPITRRDFKG